MLESATAVGLAAIFHRLNIIAKTKTIPILKYTSAKVGLTFQVSLANDHAHTRNLLNQ